MNHSLTHIMKAGGLTVAAFLCVASFGCTPVRQGATNHSLYSTGQPSVEVRFTPPFTLAASGRISAPAASDVNVDPIANTLYALFGDGGQGPVTRHAHSMISYMPSTSWRWGMETWPLPYTLHMSKKTASGQFWTVQMLPVAAFGDWPSEFWQANGRETPQFWLAKRWSATPDWDTRIVAEYREPAPECMREALIPLEDNLRGKEVSLPDSLELWRLCRKEIQDFSDRADASVVLDRYTGNREEPATFMAAPLPQNRPNIKKLIGDAEHIDRDNIKVD